MAPGAPLVVAETEGPYAIAELNEFGIPGQVTCPLCGQLEILGKLPKAKNKKIELSLLIHPEWLKGQSGKDEGGQLYGGSAGDEVEATIKWSIQRASSSSLIEVRGKLPEIIVCPLTGAEIETGTKSGNVPKRSNFSCAACGTVQDVLKSIKPTGKTGPVAVYATQGYCPHCHNEGQTYGGRFFTSDMTANYNQAYAEWDEEKDTTLRDFWPKTELPYGFMTHKLNGGIPNHGFSHWWKMF